MSDFHKTELNKEINKLKIFLDENKDNLIKRRRISEKSFDAVYQLLNDFQKRTDFFSENILFNEELAHILNRFMRVESKLSDFFEENNYKGTGWPEDIESYFKELDGLIRNFPVAREFYEKISKDLEANDKLKKYLGEADDYLDKIKSQHKQSSDFIEAQAHGFIQSHLIEITHKERKAARRANKWAIITIILTIILSLFFVFHWSFGASIDILVGEVIFRFGIIGAAIYLSGSLFFMANKHQKEYLRLRDFSVKMLAFESYLNNLPDEKIKNELRIQMVNNLIIPLDKK